jgi:hypothetical protein
MNPKELTTAQTESHIEGIVSSFTFLGTTQISSTRMIYMKEILLVSWHLYEE